MRTAFDLSPLYRSTVGFDRLFDLLDQDTGVGPVPNQPSYNIEKIGENQYRIIMAVAGFGPDDIEMIQQGNRLVVTGRANGPEEGKHYLHRGIANQAFKQNFDLAGHVTVTNATLENGLLTVGLTREVPETLQPRRIEIGAGAQSAPGQGARNQIGGEPNSGRQGA